MMRTQNNAPQCYKKRILATESQKIYIRSMCRELGYQSRALSKYENLALWRACQLITSLSSQIKKHRLKSRIVMQEQRTLSKRSRPKQLNLF